MRQRPWCYYCAQPQIFPSMQNAPGKANRMLGFLNRKISFKNKDVVLPLSIGVVRPHLKYVVQFWSPHQAKDIAKLEAVQRRATKMITPLRINHTRRG